MASESPNHSRIRLDTDGKSSLVELRCTDQPRLRLERIKQKQPAMEADSSQLAMQLVMSGPQDVKSTIKHITDSKTIWVQLRHAPRGDFCDAHVDVLRCLIPWTLVHAGLQCGTQPVFQDFGKLHPEITCSDHVENLLNALWNLSGAPIHSQMCLQLVLDELVCRLLCLCGHQVSTSPERGKLSFQHVTQVFEYLGANLHGLINLDCLAELVGISRFHFSRLFQARVGKPTMQFVRELRIERAAYVLAFTGRPISEVAVESGFFDQSHLTRVFRASMEQTPAQYRRTQRRK